MNIGQMWKWHVLILYHILCASPQVPHHHPNVSIVNVVLQIKVAISAQSQDWIRLLALWTLPLPSPDCFSAVRTMDILKWSPTCLWSPGGDQPKLRSQQGQGRPGGRKVKCRWQAKPWSQWILCWWCHRVAWGAAEPRHKVEVTLYAAVFTVAGTDTCGSQQGALVCQLSVQWRESRQITHAKGMIGNWVPKATSFHCLTVFLSGQPVFSG